MVKDGPTHVSGTAWLSAGVTGVTRPRASSSSRIVQDRPHDSDRTCTGVRARRGREVEGRRRKRKRRKKRRRRRVCWKIP